MGEVNQMLGGQVADFALAAFAPVCRRVVGIFYTVRVLCVIRLCIALPHPINRQHA